MKKAILEYIATNADNKKTVERVLKREFGISSKLMIFLKLNGKITINGNISRSVDTLKAGDKLVADVSENIVSAGILPAEIELDILYEDEYLMVVNKTGGIEVHPSMGDNLGTLANAVINHWQKNGECHNYHIVNRLDKNTSGLCVIAKNRYAHASLSEQIKSKTFKRRYIAIVHGLFNKKTGTIEKPIKRASESIIKRIVAEDGKYAKTNYSVKMSKNNEISVLEIELETGRTHQIRVHFSSIGHPLIGDWLYGTENEKKYQVNRHALHAAYISFNHPKTRERMTFEVPLPEDLRGIVE